MRRFPCASLPEVGATFTLPEDVLRHAVRVLRLELDTPFRLFDGAGREVVVRRIDETRAEVLEALVVDDATRRRAVHLWMALLKGPAMDDALRMATEAGATSIQPLHTARTVPDGDRRDRWLRILEQAARQSGRTDVPTLHPPRPLHDAVRDLPSDTVGVYADAAGRPDALDGVGTRAVVVAVGPEGGWAPKERELLDAAGFRTLRLGPWTLRACTAAPVAVAAAIEAG
jgi:16S rRNA (uracil1498-N3)-methyltransferase